MPSENIMGRDCYIVAQALATAYALIGSLPEMCREESNRQDTAALLREMLGPDWQQQAELIRHVLSAEEWRNGKAVAHAMLEGARH